MRILHQRENQQMMTMGLHEKYQNGWHGTILDSSLESPELWQTRCHFSFHTTILQPYNHFSLAKKWLIFILEAFCLNLIRGCDSCDWFPRIYLMICFLNHTGLILSWNNNNNNIILLRYKNALNKTLLLRQVASHFPHYFVSRHIFCMMIFSKLEKTLITSDFAFFPFTNKMSLKIWQGKYLAK